MWPVSRGTYQVLVDMVKGCFKKAVRERSRLERTAAVLFWRRKNKLSVRTVNGNDILLYDGKRVVIQDSMPKMVKNNRKKTKGGGARSVAYTMKGKYEGVSERRIKKVLDTSKGHGEIQAKFTNKPPIKFVTATKVFERVQIDLLAMSEVQSMGQPFKYILTAVDVFSRFVFCRPLQKKSAKHVATSIKALFDEHGWPNIIQCDNGPEFMGAVGELFRRKNIKVIKSRPYHPQSQGKVERQNRIIRKKIRHELGRRGERGFNWVDKIQEIANSINRQPKEVLGYQSPFAVYFGRAKDKTANEVRKIAVKASYKCNRRTYVWRLKKNECSIYERGALVLVKYPFGKRVPYKRFILKGKILKRGYGLSRYKVIFKKPDGSMETQWVSVQNLTSRTLQEERRRRKQAFDLLKKKEQVRKHKERFYLPLHDQSRRQALYNEENETISDVETAEDSQRLFAGNRHINIVEDPQEVGNCQFIAVSDQIRTVGIHRSGMQLRQVAISHIQRHKAHYRSFVTGSIDTYLNKMTKIATFGDNITLVALARELNCQFIIINSQGPLYHRVVSNTGVYDQEMLTFTLGFYPEIHYVSVNVSNQRTLQEIINWCGSSNALSRNESEVTSVRNEERERNCDEGDGDYDRECEIDIDTDRENDGICREDDGEEDIFETPTQTGSMTSKEDVDDQTRDYDKETEMNTDIDMDSDIYSKNYQNECIYDRDTEIDTGTDGEDDLHGPDNEEWFYIRETQTDKEEDKTDDNSKTKTDSPYDRETQTYKHTDEESNDLDKTDKEDLFFDLERHSGIDDDGDDDMYSNADVESLYATETQNDSEMQTDEENSDQYNYYGVEEDEFDNETGNDTHEDDVYSKSDGEQEDDPNCDHARENVDDEDQRDDDDEGNGGIRVPHLPYLVLERIIFYTVRSSPLMRYTLQMVSPDFAEIVRRLGYPQIYLRPTQAIDLPTPVSIARLSRIYGTYSGLLLRIRRLLSESGGRWFRAWLTLREVGNGWFDIVNVTWR